MSVLYEGECAHENVEVDDDGLDRRWYHCVDCDRAVVPDGEPDAMGWSFADDSNDGGDFADEDDIDLDAEDPRTTAMMVATSMFITESEARVLDGNR